MSNVEVTIKEGKISISKPQESESDALPEIYKIDCIDKDDELDLSHITNIEYREIVSELINDYNPDKTQETNVKMSIVVKDNESVFQTARRLSPAEREKVNMHIDNWLREGIIQPSLSDYASSSFS